MSALRRAGRRYAPKMVAGLVIVLAYGLAAPSEPEADERAAAASRFGFDTRVLELPVSPVRTDRRAVHPSLRHIDSWISSVGAAVALADLDGDGSPNDVCLVDPRVDEPIVMPLAGTGRRFTPRLLDTPPGPFDAATIAPMGCVPADLDEDGASDLLVYYWGRPPVLFLRRGDTYEPVALVGDEERWNTNAATTADLDGDGHLDLIFGNYFADGAPILDPNGDGRVSMQHSMSRATNAGRNRILRWVGLDDGRPRFEAADVLDDEVAHAWTLAVGATDLDGDLLPEVYFANDFGSDRLLHNRSRPGEIRFGLVEGPRELAQPRSTTLGRDSFKGMGVDFGDVDLDGRLDFMVSNITTDYALHESNMLYFATGAESWAEGRAPFVNRAEALGVSRSGWGWDTRLADFDNDGVLEAVQATGFVRGEVDRWPELQELATSNDELLADPRIWPRFSAGDDLSGHQPNPFFVRVGERYVDLSGPVGIGEPVVSRGIALGDVDDDGDLDMVVANQWAPSVAHVNECPRCGNALVLRPVLGLEPGPTRVVAATDPRPRARPAVGARAEVALTDRVAVGVVDGGSGHSGVRAPEIHLGVGSTTGPVEVRLRYRDPRGRVRETEITVRPGVHVVLLGWQEGT